MADRDSVIYLDVDDEITSVASRIRGVDGGRVAVVVPPGSRIATSRINFRLLAREALAQGRRLAVVAPDGASRALAASAGLPVFGSVGEFESTAASAEAPAVATAPGPASAEEGTILIPPAAGEVAATNGDGPVRTGVRELPREPGMPGDARPSAGGRPADVPVADRRISARAGRGRGIVLPLIAGLVVLALVVGAVAGYVLLPSATVVVTPRVEALGPVSFEVRADPSATSVDETGGVIPATRLSFDLTATDTFRATGARVEKEAATGSVRWTNCDPTASYRIPAGAVVRTRTGIRFATTESVFLPVAALRGGGPNVTVDRQSNSTGIKAVDPGPDGNVDANAITVPPANYNGNVIRVTNPEPTSGGVSESFPKIAKKDVDGALAALRKKLSSELDAKLGEPDSVPQGTTVFPDTAKLSTPEPDVDPNNLVGAEQDTFELTLTATATVVAVDEAPLDDVAAARMRSSIRAGHTLVEGSITSQVGKPDVNGETITFPVEASAKQVATLDAQVLREAIRGRSVDDARAVLESYGAVDITTWPGWVDSIPTLDQRLELRIEPAAGTAPAGSGGSDSPPASSSPSGSASPSESGGS
jgi:hypothetical protein